MVLAGYWKIVLAAGVVAAGALGWWLSRLIGWKPLTENRDIGLPIGVGLRLLA